MGREITPPAGPFPTKIRTPLKQAGRGFTGGLHELFFKRFTQQRGAAGAIGMRQRIHPGNQLFGNFQRNRGHERKVLPMSQIGNTGGVLLDGRPARDWCKLGACRDGSEDCA